MDVTESSEDVLVCVEIKWIQVAADGSGEESRILGDHGERLAKVV